MSYGRWAAGSDAIPESVDAILELIDAILESVDAILRSRSLESVFGDHN